MSNFYCAFDDAQSEGVHSRKNEGGAFLMAIITLSCYIVFEHQQMF